MAITSKTFVIESVPSAGKDWSVSLTSEDASGVETIKAAETGYTHYLTKLVIRTDAATDMEIGSGETTPGTIDTVHLGTIPLAAASGFYLWKPPVKGMGLKFTAGASISIKASAGTIHIEAHGRSCKLPQAS
jgi:hypothetical protein